MKIEAHSIAQKLGALVREIITQQSLAQAGGTEQAVYLYSNLFRRLLAC
jgi:hypothetical protein